jgi:hypothetical protein
MSRAVRVRREGRRIHWIIRLGIEKRRTRTCRYELHARILFFIIPHSSYHLRTIYLRENMLSK